MSYSGHTIGRPKLKPLHTLLSLIAIAIVVVVPHLGLIPNFGYSIPILLFVWVCLKLSGERFADIGFRPKSFRLKAALIGAVSAVAILSIMQLLVLPALDYIFEFDPIELSLHEFLKANPAQFLFIIAMGWLVGGLYEELVFHGFIFTRLEMIIPGKHSTAIGFVASSLIFGAYHHQLGAVGAFNALVVGMVYQGLFLYFRRDLWASIVCHGVYNTMVFTMIYLELI